MDILATPDGTYEIEVPLDTTINDLILVLCELPAGAALTEHFGDVDLTVVFRDGPADPSPQT